MANFFDVAEAEPTLFNAEALAQTDEAVICRTLDEVSALMDCGVIGAITVTGGKWLKVLADSSDLLKGLRKITLALPDGPMREEMARRLGRHRCWLVDRPIADIYAAGAIDVLEALQGATPYPIEGVQRLTVGSLLKLRRQPAPTVMTSLCGRQ